MYLLRKIKKTIYSRFLDDHERSTLKCGVLSVRDMNKRGEWNDLMLKIIAVVVLIGLLFAAGYAISRIFG